MLEPQTWVSVLNRHFDGYSLQPMPGGASGATIYRLTSAKQAHCIIKAKTIAHPFHSLGKEKAVYDWLQGRLPVPEVLFFEQLPDQELLCMAMLPGQTLHACKELWPPRQTIEVYAHALRRLHALPWDENAPALPLADRMQQARYHLENHLVDGDDMEPANRSMSPEELYERLLGGMPATEDLVFTHGDYCFDNLLCSGENLSGFIDMGRGGVADRYQDIALAARSILHELGPQWLGYFYQQYGLPSVDQQKIEFYMLLDEFF